jgi:uncharacterized protein with GYD domain
MPTYITLLRWTTKGIENIKESPARLDAAKAATEAAGGKFVGFYLTMGQYDAVAIGEWPDDEAAATFALVTGSQGNVQTETLKAFTEDEYREIIAALP